MEISQTPIEHSSTAEFANPNSEGETPFEVFWEVRKDILKACQRFGRTGPEDGCDSAISFYLVDDQYTDELYQRVAIHNGKAVSFDWLTAIIDVLNIHHGWALAIATRPGWVVVFANRIVVYGEQFASCMNV